MTKSSEWQKYVMLFVAGFLGILLSVPLAAGIKVELEYEPDLNNGKDIFGMCATCHLPEGWGADDGTFPQLAGQHENVLVQQLVDIRVGKRNNPLMYPFVQQRTLGGYQDLVDVVAFIATLPPTSEPGRGPWLKGSKEYVTGKMLYEKNCLQCHREDGEGSNEAKFPKLRGQHYAYVAQQLERIKARKRMVDPVMQSITRGLSTKQLKLVANYVSYLLPVKLSDIAVDDKNNKNGGVNGG